MQSLEDFLMTRNGLRRATRVLLLTLFVFGITATALILPSYFSSEAVARKTGTGLLTRTESDTPEFPNYDIRSDKNAADRVAGFRSSLSRSASDVADVRDGFVRGAERLRAAVPTLKVEYNTDIRTPEVIGPFVGSGRQLLTEASGGKRSDILISFLRRNAELVGASDAQI